MISVSKAADPCKLETFPSCTWMQMAPTAAPKWLFWFLRLG